jgi:serine/threonine protein kinase/WD40 repeat protein
MMDAPPTQHPTDQSLHAHGRGQLDDSRAEYVNKHLDTCPGCRRRVAELTSDSFVGRLREAQRRPDTSDPVVSSLAGLSMVADGSSSPAPPPAETLPLGLGDHPDYDIVRELGRGGMGVVYLAQNKLMGRREVLKVVGGHLVERPGARDRFLREVKSSAKLQHKNIVTAYSAMRLAEGIVLAMEYIDGDDLAKIVKSGGPLPVINACYFIYQAALGLQHAHERGMVHRDIKPANLILARDGKKAIVKVLDFGLAKVNSEGQTDSGLTREGQMLGTPDYIAPEQIRNAQSADIRADIYSLGCTFYYLLTGGSPFRGDHLWDVYQAHFSMEAEPLNLVRPEVPADLAAVVAKMMAKEPGRRFQTPGEVARALTPYFKPATTQTASSGAEAPRLESQLASTQTSSVGPAPNQQPTLDATPAPSGRRLPQTEVGEPAWESLIAIKDDGLLIEATKPKTAETKPTQAAAPVRRPPWLWPALAFGVVFFALIVAWVGVVLRVKTANGVIVLEDFSNDCRVSVDEDTVTVSWPGRGKPARIEIPPGEHKVKVTRGDNVLLAQEVTIASGKTESFTVRLEAPNASVSEGNDKSNFDMNPVESKKDEEANPWPAALRSEGQKLAAGFRVAAMSGDCRRVAIVAPSNEELRVVEAPDASKVYEVGFGEYIWRAAFSPDGKYLAVRTYNGIKILNAATGAEMRRLGGGGPTLAFNPDGDRLVAESAGFHVWEATTGEEVANFPSHSNLSWCVAFSPDRKRLASGSGRANGQQQGSFVGELKVWDLGTGTVTDLDGHPERVSGVAFSPDGQRLASASYDRTVKVWDLSTKKCLITFGKHEGMAGAVRFSPDGRLIASCGRDLPVRVWDAATGTEIAALLGPPGDYHEDWLIQFSHGGRWIYSGKESTLKAWETPTGIGTERRETAPGTIDSVQEPKMVASTDVSGKVEVSEPPLGTKGPAGPAADSTQPRPGEGRKRVNGRHVPAERRVRANQPPHVVGRWQHAANAPNADHGGIIILAADGAIHGSRGAWRGTWSQWGSVLILRWPDKQAPGGAWIDQVELSADRKRYEGFNQRGIAIHGLRVKE